MFLTVFGSMSHILTRFACGSCLYTLAWFLPHTPQPRTATLTDFKVPTPKFLRIYEYRIMNKKMKKHARGGQSTTLSFQVMKSLGGSYSVVIDSEISQLTVERKLGIPWSSILIVFLIVAAAGGYYQFIYKPSNDNQNIIIFDQSISMF